MPRAGAVWIDVLPSMRGFRRSLTAEVEEPVRQSSARAGDQGGAALVGGLKAAATAGALAVGVAVGALVTKGLETSLAKGKAAATLQGQLDLSAKDARKAGEAAGKLWSSSVTESVEEGAEAVKLVMGSGLVDSTASTKEIAKISTAVKDMSTLFEQDVVMSAKAAASMVNTGFAKDGTEAIDAMTYGFQRLGPKAEDLAETFNEYSPFLKNFGLSVKDSLGLMSQGLKAGAWDTDKIGDSFKEFYLRATGGADSVKDALKGIGLDADSLMKAVADGGPGARKALDSVLNALRKVPDETTKAQAVQELFGGPGEDLGAAIFSLNVGTASKSIGNFSGAAKKAGNSLRSDVGTQFETFKRKSLMVIGDTLSRYVLPRLMDFGKFLHSDVLPKVKDFAGFVNTRVVPGIKDIGAAFMDGVRWVKEYGLWFAPLAVAIGGVTLALSANAIATGISLGVLGAYSIAVRGITAVTRAWAVAQGIFNTVMALNPVTLVVIALVTLGTALVVAYKKSETFRNIVQGAWAGIKSAAMTAWDGYIKPAFAGFMTGMRAVGDAALWLWNNALKPAWGFISTGARILATVIGVTLYAAFKLLATTAKWLWSDALSPMFTAIGAGAMWLWNSAVKPAWNAIAAGAKWLWSGVSAAFNLFMTGIRTVASWVRWLYNAAVRPVVGWIIAGFKLAWAGVKVVFGYLMAGLRTVGGWFKWLWANAVTPALNGMKSVVSTVYNGGIRPVFDKLKSAVRGVGTAFEVGKNAIKKAWDQVKAIAKGPVSFIVNTVYNKGIVDTWNKVADVFGAPTLDHVKGFARGGVLAGTSTYRQGDDQLVPMRRGEGVAVSEAMRDPYERARLLAVNAAAMRGQSLRPFQAGQGFAKGGIFDWVKSTASKGVDLAKSGVSWLKDGIKASAEAGLNSIVKPLINKISGSASTYRDMITGIPKKMLSTIFDFSGKADTEMEKQGVGGKGFKSALAWARTQNGLPYQWGGNGNPSWDCSGFLSAIESVIRGQAPHRRWATGAFSGATAPGGWVLGAKSPFMIGITNAGVGHTAGTINGTNVESRGGDGVVVGPRARSYMDPLFTHRYGLRGFADGGRPRPGELAWVGERGPELIRFGSGVAEVYDTRTSMQMAAGLDLRGFAKGTSAAAKAKATAAAALKRSQDKAKSALPDDLTAFRKSLTGTAADIAKASAKLTKDLKAAGGAGAALAKSTDKASVKLQSMAKLRDALGARITAAKGYASDKAKTVSDFLGVSNFAEVGSIGELISGLQGRQTTAKSFTAAIEMAQKRGASKGFISQLIEMGPESKLAGLVSRAGASDMKQLNALVANGAKISTSYGNAMADYMYDAGKASAKGFLTGLMAEQKSIQDAMAKLGNSAIKAIRSKKGIDAHSPSRKGKAAGGDVGAGVVAGMAAMGPAVARQAEQLGAAAVPGGQVVPVTSGRTGSGPGSGLDGMPVALVLDDGTTLAAHFDTRIDSKLATVRQRKRAGTKGR